MTATIISQAGNYTFGQMTTAMVSRLIACNSQMERLADAIATASSGYTGIPGTQFEAPATNNPSASGGNLFGVVPNLSDIGKNGTDYAYAVNSLEAAWATFWATAEAYVNQLDNGGNSM
jgi:hypothetical protein